MAYEYITNRTSPNQNARPAGVKPKSITIHHWGDDGQAFMGVVNHLCDDASDVSAHYVIEAGRVACIVNPDRRAWHAGNKTGNDTSIGLECRPEATDGDYATAAEIIRELRATYGDLPLVPHRQWTATECPGRWDLARLDALARGGKPAPTPPPAPPKPAGIAEDGAWGTDTTRKLQARFGTIVDGEVWGQYAPNRAKLAGCTLGWRWTNDPKTTGSPLIAAMQRWLAIPADGVAGAQFASALSNRMGTIADGTLWNPSPAIHEMQRRLNAGTL